jgi:hypothetical protein
MHTTEITKTRFEPTLVAPETFLIHDHQGEGTAPGVGRPQLDGHPSRRAGRRRHGMAENREQYLEDVFGSSSPRTSAGCSSATTTSTTPATSTR